MFQVFVGEIVDELGVCVPVAPEVEQVLDRIRGGLMVHIGLWRGRTGSWRPGRPTGRRTPSMIQSRSVLARVTRRRTPPGARGPDRDGSPGPAMNGYSIRPLSSQKRTKTVPRIQATATWVTRSSSHISKVAAVRSASRAACHSSRSSAAVGCSATPVRRRSASSVLTCALRSASSASRSIMRPSGRLLDRAKLSGDDELLGVAGDHRDGHAVQPRGVLAGRAWGRAATGRAGTPRDCRAATASLASRSVPPV